MEPDLSLGQTLQAGLATNLVARFRSSVGVIGRIKNLKLTYIGSAESLGHKKEVTIKNLRGSGSV